MGGTSGVEAPRVIALDRARVAPGGVVIVTGSFTSRDDVKGVFVGDRPIDVADSTSFAWPGSAIDVGPGTLAIRVPEEVAAGVSAISLFDGFARGAALEIDVIEPLVAVGPAPSLAPFFVPSRLSNQGGDPFPIPVRNPRPLQSSPDSNAAWTYDVILNDGDFVCRSRGTLSGVEQHEETPGSFFYDITHPINGTYEVGTDRDRVDVVIDRTSSGGSEEAYVGGWAGPNPDALPSAEPEVETVAPLILTSAVTGRQLVIEHSIRPTLDCEGNTEDP